MDEGHRLSRPLAVPEGAAAWCLATWRRKHYTLRLKASGVQEVFPELFTTAEKAESRPVSLSACVPGSPPVPFHGPKLARNGNHWSISGATVLLQSLQLPRGAVQVVLWRDGASGGVCVAARGTDEVGPSIAPRDGEPQGAPVGSDDELVTDEMPGDTEEEECELEGEQEEGEEQGEGKEGEGASWPQSATRAGQGSGPAAGTEVGDPRSCKIVAAWELSRQMEVPASMAGKGGVFQRVRKGLIKGLEDKRTLRFYLRPGDEGEEEGGVEVDIGEGKGARSARLSNFPRLARALGLRGGDCVRFAPHRDGHPTHFVVEGWRLGPGGRWQRLQSSGPQLDACATVISGPGAGVAAAAGEAAAGAEEGDVGHPASSAADRVTAEVPGRTEEEGSALGRALYGLGPASAAAGGVSRRCYRSPLSCGGLPERHAAALGDGGPFSRVGQGPQVKRPRHSAVVPDVGVEEGGMELDVATALVPGVPGPTCGPRLAQGLEAGAGGGAEGRSAAGVSRPEPLAAIAAAPVTAHMGAASGAMGARQGSSTVMSACSLGRSLVPDGSRLELERSPETAPASAPALLPGGQTPNESGVSLVSSLTGLELWELVRGPGPPLQPVNPSCGGGETMGSSGEPAYGATPTYFPPGSGPSRIGSTGFGELSATTAACLPAFTSPPQPPATGDASPGSRGLALPPQGQIGPQLLMGRFRASLAQASPAPSLSPRCGTRGAAQAQAGSPQPPTLLAPTGGAVPTAARPAPTASALEPQPRRGRVGRSSQIILEVTVTAGMLRKGYLQVHPTFAADFGLAPQPGAETGVDPASARSLPLRLRDASPAAPAGACEDGAAAGAFADVTLSVTPAGPGRKAVCELRGLGSWMAAHGVAEGSVVGVVAFQPRGDFSIALVGAQPDGGLSGEGSDMEVTEEESDAEVAS
ncbi:hypothetical protein HYH03_007390 [Edaphochlamys debaryana]|uniref:Uncharacterized protein n=1 Tax=Edaphochlamys debaryana TaxID=47281 RepID=A0A835Y353_9CHLO|nr:hypothetical protein HYH03_007390 [Edaphochlamys debaryana]|eukprot:KAG2494332.1 hypothetical protein HYH03_007390 [Edaphochlamys debaryana]